MQKLKQFACFVGRYIDANTAVEALTGCAGIAWCWHMGDPIGATIGAVDVVYHLGSSIHKSNKRERERKMNQQV